jgi:hypothetical protein
MKPTLIFLGPREINGQQFSRGDELPPDLLSQDMIDRWLDHRWLAEYHDRRSLYHIFAPFTGSKEREQLTKEELTAYALTE